MDTDILHSTEKKNTTLFRITSNKQNFIRVNLMSRFRCGNEMSRTLKHDRIFKNYEDTVRRKISDD